MPYITSMERLAKQERKAEGKVIGEAKGRIKLLQELLAIAVMSDAELGRVSSTVQYSLKQV